jgi:hypothetical protein
LKYEWRAQFSGQTIHLQHPLLTHHHHHSKKARHCPELTPPPPPHTHPVVPAQHVQCHIVGATPGGVFAVPPAAGLAAAATAAEAAALFIRCCIWPQVPIDWPQTSPCTRGHAWALNWPDVSFTAHLAEQQQQYPLPVEIDDENVLGLSKRGAKEGQHTATSNLQALQQQQQQWVGDVVCLLFRSTLPPQTCHCHMHHSGDSRSQRTGSAPGDCHA